VRDGATGISLSQSRYVPLGIASDRMLRRWQIPVCLSRGEAKACTLLKDGDASIPPLAGAGALVPNAAGAGYYRFSLDEAGWDRLIAAAATLPEREAMVVGDSIWAEFAAGRIDFARVVKAAEALARHSERLPGLELGGKLVELSGSILSDAELPAYRALMQRFYGSRAEMQGFDPAVPVADARIQGWRESLVPVLALQARDPALRARLKDAASRYLAGDTKALAPVYRRSALAVTVQDGGIAAANTLLAALKASQDPLFRAQAASALGAAEGADAVAHVQGLAMGEGLISRERTTILASLTFNRSARDATTTYIASNFKKVVESFPGFARSGIISFFDGYCSREAVDRVESLIRPNLAVLGGGELELSQTKERIGQCAALKEAKGADISAALLR
jgi:ERAP1-like C-terminal domain